MTLELRAARPADLPALLALEGQFPGDRMSRRSILRLLERPTALWIVADDLGSLRGYALVLLRSGSDIARLYSLIVAPEARGHGVGLRLTTAAMVAARDAGRRRLRLEVRSDNGEAIALYRRAGFREIGRKPDYYEDGQEALRLEAEMSLP